MISKPACVAFAALVSIASVSIGCSASDGAASTEESQDSAVDPALVDSAESGHVDPKMRFFFEHGWACFEAGSYWTCCTTFPSGRKACVDSDG
ncbi:MAG: hypothetical protein IPG50_23850 [Myxococcales bacterium]|nr:hypothetical protein [Myxococcales bacterium]